MILRKVDFKNGRWIGSCPMVLAAPKFDVQSQLRYESVGIVTAGSEGCRVTTLCVHHYVNLQLLENKGMSSSDNLEQLHQGLILFIWDLSIVLFVFNMTATMFWGWMCRVSLAVFLDANLYSQVERNVCFRGMCCLHLEGSWYRSTPAPSRRKLNIPVNEWHLLYMPRWHQQSLLSEFRISKDMEIF